MRIRVGVGVMVLLMGQVVLAQPGANTVDRAIDRGVAYLKNAIRNSGGLDGYDGGGQILAGLALLEAGIPGNDPVVQAITKMVRDNAFGQVKTYQTALSILYLDRLGERRDVPIIQMLGLRLLAGQNANGGWTYNTIANVDDNTQRQLRTALGEVNLRTDPPPPLPKGDEKEPARPALHKDVEAYGKLLAQQVVPANNLAIGGMDDNSNTQFAVMGVWVARKHGVPVDNALALIDTRFRAMQDRASGGWSYAAGQVGTTSASMTCAGLIGLAVGHGLAAELKTQANPPKGVANRPALGQDPAVKAGFACLSAFLTGQVNPMGMMGSGNAGDLYMMWSVERVGVIYGVNKIGPVDWYEVGSNRLLRTQNPDGSWTGTYQGVVDTSFAILFLLRANVAKDLSTKLRGKLGGAEMRSGAGPVDPSKMFPPPGTGKEPPAQVVKNPPMRELPNPIAQPKTGPNAGPAANPDAARLGRDLVSARGEAFNDILTQLRETRGSGYTEALAKSIDQLDTDGQKKARDALARRLTRMTADTLSQMLRSDQREIRRAAAIAAAMKDEKSHIGDIITLLADPDPVVNRGAKAALVSLSGQDFGPSADASPVDRAKSIANWRAWHKTQQP